MQLLVALPKQKHFEFKLNSTETQTGMQTPSAF
jgi:hypothetical protein